MNPLSLVLWILTVSWHNNQTNSCTSCRVPYSFTMGMMEDRIGAFPLFAQRIRLTRHEKKKSCFL